MKNTQRGFGTIGIVSVLLVLSIIGFGGYRVLISHNQQYKAKSYQPTNASSTKTDSTLSKISELPIKELMLKLPLTQNTKDAYYVVNSSSDSSKPPIIKFSTLSLDKYPDCKASSDSPGIASIQSFKNGDTDPIQGDYSKAYPGAYNFNGTYFYVSGDQADCTRGMDYDLYTKIRTDFLNSYSHIAAL